MCHNDIYFIKCNKLFPGTNPHVMMYRVPAADTFFQFIHSLLLKKILFSLLNKSVIERLNLH